MLYASNKPLEFEVKNPILVTLAHPEIKYLTINVTKIGTISIWGKLQNYDEQNERSTK